MHVWIHDHKTLGKDKLIAEGEVDVRAVFELWRSSRILIATFRFGTISCPVETSQLTSRLPYAKPVNFVYGSSSTETPILVTTILLSLNVI